MADNIPTTGRPFPWRCIKCKEREVYPLETDYITTVKHDGRPYEIRIPDLSIPTCRKCGERVITSKVDDEIVAALRIRVGLLMPQEMQQSRNQLELSQQELAEQLGVAKETISRWETGAMIQSRAMDNLMRLYFASEEVRSLLARRFKPPAIERIKWPRIKQESYTAVGFSLFAMN